MSTDYAVKGTLFAKTSMNQVNLSPSFYPIYFYAF